MKPIKFSTLAIFAALAQDASTVVGNPAGMKRLDRSQLTGSMFTMLPSMQCTGRPQKVRRAQVL